MADSSRDGSALRSIAVVGAGAMGSGIAQVFATAGMSVWLLDRDGAVLPRAQNTIARSLERFVEKGTIARPDRDRTLAHISVGTDLDLVADAAFVIEAIVEEVVAKQHLFAELDQLAPPHVCLASNTSSISITTLAAATTRPDRVVGLHFMNPVPVMELVEVVRGRHTSNATMATTLALVARVGKTAVESADTPGFIANRILMPMINEAVFALMQGVGTADAIDTVMRLGMRHPMGPLALADLIGLDVCVAILEVMHAGLGDVRYVPCPLLRQLVAEGHLGRKSGRGFYEYPA